MSDVYVGESLKELRLGSEVPMNLASRPWFHTESGGCNTMAYFAGMTLKGTAIAVGVVFRVRYLFNDRKLC